MKLTASNRLQPHVSNAGLSTEHIIINSFGSRVVPAVSKAVADATIKISAARI